MNRIPVVTLAVGLVALAACQSPQKRLNAPPHGIPEETSDMQGTFVYMQDNALLSDMSVSDRHFMPHRALLTTLGEERLCRLVSLMEAYGGTIRLNTNESDEDLIKKRMDVIVQFLADAGIDTTTEVLTRDHRGGAGMDANEVILIKANEGTYKPKKSGDGVSGVSAGPLGSP
jgi:hypothetical protein